MDAILINTVLATAIWAGLLHLRRDRRRLRLPVATLVLAAVTLTMSTLANLNPVVLAALGRDRDQLLAGQLWRLVTPLFAQDGGWPGTISNIVGLLFVGTIVETLHPRRVLVGVYFLAGILSEIAAYSYLPNQGFAGNSVADLGIAALLLVTAVTARRTPAQAVAVLGLLAGTILLVTGNLHGVGFTAGSLAAAAVAWRHRRHDAGLRA